MGPADDGSVGVSQDGLSKRSGVHSYPLHRDIETECACCRLVQSFKFTSKHDQVICKACLRHIGS